MFSAFILFLSISACFAAVPSETRASTDLRIGAFNVQVFGVSKMSNPDVVNVLVDIIIQYDVILIQEIRDSTNTAFPQLVDDVNAASGNAYSYVISGRLGRTSSKEQYGFIYRHNNVKVIDQWQYDDVNDYFERPPYVVTFERLIPGIVQKFSYIPLHAKPDAAKQELNDLPQVYIASEPKDGENSLLMGDFNADCSYVCNSCWDQISLWTDPTYTWLIGNDADTTTTNSDCAYDRVVVAGSTVTGYATNPTVYRFDLDFNLSDELTEDVSDHYPVDVYLP